MRNGETQKQFEARAKANNLTPREQTLADQLEAKNLASLNSAAGAIVTEVVKNEKKTEVLSNRIMAAESQVEELKDQVDGVETTAKAVAYKQTNQMLEQNREQTANVLEHAVVIRDDIQAKANALEENAGTLLQRIEAHSGSDHLKLKAIIARLTTR